MLMSCQVIFRRASRWRLHYLAWSSAVDTIKIAALKSSEAAGGENMTHGLQNMVNEVNEHTIANPYVKRAHANLAMGSNYCSAPH
ncbi:hypothetical protein CHS0354_015069 [Potamilus streckersoni]|uniref:Uncharacterized protein n=1 Tax=Potamilus streckersoni TaxID=2493646 RepID=A0AAE0TGA4_9BIVA|nr:hypothetical protein CHS0354_015069 [Potamilus streckersoni]